MLTHNLLGCYRVQVFCVYNHIGTVAQKVVNQGSIQTDAPLRDDQAE
jgi:hypothetical protein